QLCRRRFMSKHVCGSWPNPPALEIDQTQEADTKSSGKQEEQGDKKKDQGFLEAMYPSNPAW
ncbi:MAG: hypothetical protein ABIV47_26630, partial [Roseiflexaceae bacterium]